jgi:hypothetical protein
LIGVAVRGVRRLAARHQRYLFGVSAGFVAAPACGILGDLVIGAAPSLARPRSC